MIDTLNIFLIPLEDNAVLWRYMDLSRFESLLTQKSLFFCRADKFNDSFEGSILKKESEYLNKKSHHTRVGFEKTYKDFRRSSIISCWHISQNESKSMWALYSQTNGIAIRTSKERLFESLKGYNGKIWASQVRYLDYENDTWYGKDYPKPLNFLSPLIHKRIEYQDEKEFRLIIHKEEIMKDNDYWERQSNKSGCFVEVDVIKLIDKIILSPEIDAIGRKKIEEMANIFGLIIENSKLSNSPFF